MKIVLDTNVLISAFLFKGLSASVYDYCVSHTEVHLSVWIMNEFLEKLDEKFSIDSATRKAIAGVIEERVTISEPTVPLPAVCRDKDDNHVLRIAESISADFIITGDKDLLVLKEYKHIKMVTPRKFSDTIIESTKS